jgi:hypothetical protein
MNNDDICLSLNFLFILFYAGEGGREEGVENTILASAVHNCVQPMLII